ncbi:hypothetical protein [Alkanindiges illinoisensis]|uniref:Uncharacterized protein n=1 Tax=Alkanindiges illinoisensis TaxID=197183 RepID=A0A4Y7X8Y0_9GAMM|nr:hypothetical protein [Alkanindiges illinoisensis]TEU23042.1 hypothetical protein E2B99_14170 [Alkanindiges illinoisensis]
MPKTVNIAIKLIWISLIISMLLSIAQRFLGDISLNDLITALVVNVLMCLIPYKLARKSNISRFVFTALFVLSILFILAAGSEIQVTLLDKVDLLINIPLNIYSIYLLFFNQPAQQWFEEKRV